MKFLLIMSDMALYPMIYNTPSQPHSHTENKQPESVSLPQGPKPSNACAPQKAGVDFRTGLLNRAAAEASIRALISNGGGLSGLFCIKFLAVLQRRHGDGLVDQVSLNAARKLTERLPRETLVFLWSPSNFVLTTKRQDNSAESELSRCAAISLDLHYDFGTRMAFVPVKTTFQIQRVDASRTAEYVIEKFDSALA